MLSELWGSFLTSLYYFLRPMLKWILKKVTGKCELLRITYQYQPGAERTRNVEESLKLSRKSDIKRLTKDENTNVEAAVLLVMKAKYIIPEVHPRFEDCLRKCLLQISGYNRLLSQVDQMRQTKYSSDNQEHEKKLLQLWTLLMPDEKLESRQSHQWTTIGFQGNDPQTDFRGMGLLGLNQLIYFAAKYSSQAKQLLLHSHHPKTGYSYAIVGINMTDLVYNFLKKGNLKTHFYNLKQDRPNLEDFHEVYCYCFHEFDKFWREENPKDIMEFGKVREKYRKKTVSKLKTHNVVLKADFQGVAES